MSGATTRAARRVVTTWERGYAASIAQPAFRLPQRMRADIVRRLAAAYATPACACDLCLGYGPRALDGDAPC